MSFGKRLAPEDGGGAEYRNTGCLMTIRDRRVFYEPHRQLAHNGLIHVIR